MSYDIDHEGLTVTVDWHGYALDQVATWSVKIVEAAWIHGFGRVEFIHGAAQVSPETRRAFDRGGRAPRGSIKSLLRKQMSSRQWRRYVKDRREGGHSIMDGSMTLALRDNPDPNPRAPWPLIPTPAHR